MLWASLGVVESNALGRGVSLVDGKSLGDPLARLGDELGMSLGPALWRLDGAAVGALLGEVLDVDRASLG